MSVKVDVPSALVPGDVEEGYGPVGDAFRRNFSERGEIGAACTVYRDGVKVVDLWGGYRDVEAPETWSEICGWYSPEPGPVTNLFTRALMGAGAEVMVRGGHLMLKPLHPIPAIRRGMRLYPDDPGDPWVFRLEVPDQPPCRVQPGS